MTRYTPRHSSTRVLVPRADAVQADRCAQDSAWGTGGWTRRRFIAGAGMVGAAGLASQLVTSRVSFADAATTPDTNTLIVIFMRGAADGLRILVPNSAALGLDYLHQVRANLVPAAGTLVALPDTGGWALNSSLKPLYDNLWSTGELAFVPGVSTPDIPRSHFQAQQYLEKGGSASATTGWLDRLLAGLAPGTTFRAVSEGSAAPLSLAGDQPSIALSSIGDFSLGSNAASNAAREAAIATLYRGIGGTLGEDVPTTLAALDTAARIKSGPGVQNGANYPGNNGFANALKDLAAILRAEVGLQVATVDVGGWDTHTDEAHDLDANLAVMAQALTAFMTDLGPDRRKRVTVAVQTEFGRRVATNGTGGTDHGHGSVMWLLGGGLAGSGVRGTWTPLSATSLAQGDVPGVNNPFDVLGELAQTRLGAGSLSTVFPGHTLKPLALSKRG